MILKTMIIEDFKKILGIKNSQIFKENINCEDFLLILDSFVLKEKQLSKNDSDIIINEILERVASLEYRDEQCSKEDLEFYNLLSTFCTVTENNKDSVIIEKRVNRNLSRIAKRRWIRYRQKYLRAIKDAQESFNSKPCQKNIRDLLKKESYSREDIFTLIKAMNSSLTHYVIYNELLEKVNSEEKLPEEVLSELNEINFNLFQEGMQILENKSSQEFNFQAKDLVYFANEVFCNAEQQINFLE